jgi:hypothetical protein
MYINVCVCVCVCLCLCVYICMYVHKYACIEAKEATTAGKFAPTAR